MPEVYANNAATVVSAGGTGAPSSGTVESWTVATPGAFPALSAGQTFHVADPASATTAAEKIKVTAVSGSTWTVTRGDESTTPVAHDAGFTVVQVVTAGGYRAFVQSVTAGDTSIVVGGTGQAPTLETGTLDVIAADHPPAAAWSNNSKKITGLANGTLSSDAAAFGQIPASLPPNGSAGGDLGSTYPNPTVTATHLASALPVAQGGTGQGTQQAAIDALAGAVTSGDYLRGNGTHAVMAAIQQADLGATSGSSPYAYAPLLYGAVWGYPWRFNLFSYGAKGDGIIVSDGAMSSSVTPTVLTCGTTAPFKSGDVGKAVVVAGAGGGTFTPLVTTIASFTSATQVTLSAPATSTVSAAVVQYATDDLPAAKSALAAAVTYGQAHANNVEVEADPFLYGFAGAATIGGAGFVSNGQLRLPFIADTAEKLAVTFKGSAGNAGGLNHWLQQVPQCAGAFFMNLRNDGTNNGTFGPAFVVAGPFQNAGNSTGFSNCLVTVDNIGIIAPYNGSYGGWGMLGVGEVLVRNTAYMAAAVPPATPVVPTMSSTTPIASGFTYGLMMPEVNNNAYCDIQQYSCEGATVGLLMSEHTWFDSVRMVYCEAGIQCGSFGGISSPHSCGGNTAVIEDCASAVVGLNSTSHVHIKRIDLESASAVFDPGNLLQGEIGFAYNGAGAYGSVSGVTGGSALRIVDLMQTLGPVGSPQAPPATTVAWPNLYYRDAWITLSVTGTLTALSIDSTAQAVPVNAQVYRFLLPSGHSYTPVYTGALTHTVSLI